MCYYFHNIRALTLRVINKFFVILKKTEYFENGVGIKAFNKPPFDVKSCQHRAFKEIDINDIYLGFDGLKDEYTHIEMSLKDSPHFELINNVFSGNDISKTQYVKEEINGRLDGRFEMAYSKSLLKLHIKLAQTANKQKNLPIVYNLGRRYYVIDGKHRLATSLICNKKTVKCIEVSSDEVANHKYSISLLEMMKRRPSEYSKNIKHLELL